MCASSCNILKCIVIWGDCSSEFKHNICEYPIHVGFEVTTMDEAAKKASIFVTATGCCEILRPEHFLEMRDESICCNIGHFDCEVDVAWLEKNCKKTQIKPQV